MKAAKLIEDELNRGSGPMWKSRKYAQPTEGKQPVNLELNYELVEKRLRQQGLSPKAINRNMHILQFLGRK